MATQAQLAAVQQLYVGYLGRAADSAGLTFWADAIANGTATIASVATGFTLSAEYQAAYAGLSSGDLVDQVYTNVLGRAADAEGKAYWVDALAKGTVTADTLVSFIVTNLGAVDQATINNKTFVAQTYTDTVGAEYNATAGANVLVGVDSTPASVTTALAAISNGTLEGQVPGLNLVTTLTAAQTAQTTFETANQASVDALLTKLGLDPDNYATYAAGVQAAANEAATVRGNGTSTGVLTADAADKAATTATAYAALSTTEKAQADKYVAAIAAEATAKAGATTAVDYAAVTAGLDADATAATGLGANSAADIYSDYVLGNAAARKAIDDSFAGSTYYATFKAAAVKDAAYADALKATAAAADTLDTNTGAGVTVGTINGIVVTSAADATAGSANAQTYVSALTAKTAADTALATAKAADIDVAAAKSLTDAYAAVTKTTADAGQAITDFNNDVANIGVVAVKDLDTSVVATNTVKDVFYFADKASITAGDDYTIASFAAGDSIVLGSGYTFNSGALTTGNNNALELFLVDSNSGVQVVVESSVFGSGASTVNATTGVIAPSASTTVITLTGVTAAELTVNNGVISHVA